MPRRHRVPAWLGAALMLLMAAHAARGEDVYRGLCDASAAVALDAGHFVVAGDEDNTLRVYRRGAAEAVARRPLADFLGSGDRESDIEGAARIGDRIYWIGSHARNKNGKEREERQRLFATDVDRRGTPPSLAPAGVPYRRLLDDLRAAPSLKAFRLDDAARLAPEAPGGLNIEGLAAMPDGGLLIGLRNPIPNGRALLVPLLNPTEVIAGTQPARLGEPILLPLRGRGVRSIERVGDGYLIVAGPTADAGPFSLYRWRGGAHDKPEFVQGADLTGLRPEALFAWPERGSVQLLSDDGGVKQGGVECKQRPAAQQAFRSIELRP